MRLATFLPIVLLPLLSTESRRTSRSPWRTEPARRSKPGLSSVELLKDLHLSGWVRTRKVLIDQDAVPHSHPVLKVQTRHLKDDLLLLSTFVDEQYHCHETAHPTETAAAIAELKTTYPSVPVSGQHGASDEGSSYLHIIVCYAE